MSDDDPFAVVVKPSEGDRKMSSYLKKHRKLASGQQPCIEESSHGTTSTRSTTASTRTDKSNGFGNSKSSSNSGGSAGGSTAAFSAFDEVEGNDSCNPIEFGLSEFGSGLEFGQGSEIFGSVGDGTSTTSERKATLRKPQSMRDFGGPAKRKDDPFGGSATFATDAFDAFEEEDIKFDGDNPFGDSDSFRNIPRKNSRRK